MFVFLSLISKVKSAQKSTKINWENNYWEQQTYHFITLAAWYAVTKTWHRCRWTRYLNVSHMILVWPDQTGTKKANFSLYHHHQVVYFLSGAKLGIWIFYGRVCVLCLPSMATGMTWIFMGHVTLERYGKPNVCFKSNQLSCSCWFIHRI